VLAAALALAASAAWGIGDFLGGWRSRTLAPLAVLAVSQPVGLTLLGIAVAGRWQGPPGPKVLLVMPAALLGTLGLFAFYRGMAAGAISVVAPIAGTAAVLPVVYGLATGDRPSLAQEMGFAAAVGGVVLSSLERGAAGRVPLAAGVGWGLLAALAFGGYFVPMHEASRDDFLWAAFLFRATSATLVWSAVLSLRPALGPTRPYLATLAAIGVADTGGNVLFAAASARGIVSVVSVLASLYPVVTVLLAQLALRERVERTQRLGVAVTLAGIVAVSAG
jgi:drug/metabolite transporter (DMT)-like permease